MNYNILPATLTMLSLGLGFAILLSIAYRYLKVVEDPNIKKVEDVLPGLNCGACGFASCHTYAEYVVKEKDLSIQCRLLDKQGLNKISEILNINIDIQTSLKAVVHCSGTKDKVKTLAEYKGVQTCRAAQLIKEGFLTCKYGCLGLGDCVRACPVDAIKIENGLAKIDINKCIGCGLCVEACPRNVISLEELNDNGQLIKVACNSHDNPKDVRQACKAGCIGCRICEKKGPDDVFKVKDNLAEVDYNKAKQFTEWQEVINACPVKCISLDEIKKEQIVEKS